MLQVVSVSQLKPNRAISTGLKPWDKAMCDHSEILLDRWRASYFLQIEMNDDLLIESYKHQRLHQTS